MITKKRLLELGFETLPHFTIDDGHLFDVGRNRHISFGSAETPNEMVFLTQLNDNNNAVVDDVIVINNYDYDGWMTEEKLKALIFTLTGKKL